MEELRGAGFEVEQHPTLGYRLCSSPDRLIADDLRARFGPGTGFVRDIIVLAETGSTNDVAAKLGAEGAEGGVLVLAETQTAGRGRFGRRWNSAAHCGIWMSLLLRPALPLEKWTRLTTWAAVSVAAAVGGRASIKWPNDVQIDGKKVAGILTEVGASAPGLSGSARPFVVIGIGLNANQEPADFPPELATMAQSLRMALGEPVDRAELLVSLLGEMERRWPAVEKDFGSLVAEAAARSSLLGRWVQVTVAGAPAEGVAEELDDEGHLMLRQADGSLLALSGGEVTLHASRA